MSKLINQSRLQKFAEGLWTKIKDRYDDAFVGATLTAAEKKIKFTKKKGGPTVDVDLADYARLQDRNEFKQDVSADNVAIIDNRNIGTDFGADSKDRSLGFRRLTTDSFSDGYIDHIRINIPNSSTNTNAGTTSRWFVWAVKQGANGKNGDTVTKVVCNNSVINVDTVNEKKFVKIPVEYSFENGTYFIVRCTTHQLEVVNRVSSEYSEDVVNMNNTQPPMEPGAVINWASGDNITRSNTVVMQLFGRESIGSLSLKLKQTQADSSKYVLKSETTTTSEADKVVRLDNNGKLHKDMLPSIAVNDYFPVDTFTDAQLGALKYENGDVVFDRATQKRYLCINKGTTNSTTEFVELNSRDGVVQSVNGKVGAITLELQATSDKVKLNIGNGTDTTETAIPVISDDEITEILSRLN